MLYELGFLGPEAVLGQALYTAGHSQLAYPYGDDLRPDLGRLAPVAQADIVICDLRRMRTEPFLDPIKTLAPCCDGEVVKHVMVQGRWLVENHWLTVWDEEEMLADVRTSTDAA